MKLNANEMISRATERTSRALYLCFAGFIFAYFIERKTADWNILGQTFTNEEFDRVLIGLFFFLIISHIIHWGADYVAYTKWFDRNTPTNSEPDEIYKMEATESPSAAMYRLLQDYQKMCKDLISRPIKESDEIETIRQRLLETIKIVEKKNKDLGKLEKRLGTNFKHLHFTAQIVIIGWYGLVPIGLGVYALFYLLLGPFQFMC
jgi:hypothetical protein